MPDAVAVARDAADDSVDEVLHPRRVERAEAQRVERRHRPRAHREDVAQDPADAGRRALVRLDEGRMVVRLHLERDREPVADVDDRRRSRPGPGSRAGRWSGTSSGGRGRTCRSSARSTCREDAELDEVGLAAQDLEDARCTPPRERLCSCDGASFGVMAAGARRRRERGRRPIRTSVTARRRFRGSRSEQRSGCGIRPTTLPSRLRDPGDSAVAPLGFDSSVDAALFVAVAEHDAPPRARAASSDVRRRRVVALHVADRHPDDVAGLVEPREGRGRRSRRACRRRGRRSAGRG